MIETNTKHATCSWFSSDSWLEASWLCFWPYTRAVCKYAYNLTRRGGILRRGSLPCGLFYGLEKILLYPVIVTERELALQQEQKIAFACEFLTELLHFYALFFLTSSNCVTKRSNSPVSYMTHIYCELAKRKFLMCTKKHRTQTKFLQNRSRIGLDYVSRSMWQFLTVFSLAWRRPSPLVSPLLLLLTDLVLAAKETRPVKGRANGSKGRPG